jgi:LPS-assembly lipoprotein
MRRSPLEVSRFPALAARMKLAAVLCIALLASGCGFQLQGRARLSPLLAVVQIDAGDAQSDFVQDLRRSLLASGVKLATVPTEATAIIHVERDEFSEHVLSVSSRNIPAEYEITYTVRLSVTAGGTERMAAEDMSLSREFSFDETLLLAKQREEDSLREALARDLVGMVMRRLSAL